MGACTENLESRDMQMSGRGRALPCWRDGSRHIVVLLENCRAFLLSFEPVAGGLVSAYSVPPKILKSAILPVISNICGLCMKH